MIIDIKVHGDIGIGNKNQKIPTPKRRNCKKVVYEIM